MASSSSALHFAICQLTLISLTLFWVPSAAQTVLERGLLLHSVGGRSLLQAKKNCPVDFERQNYTILTSQCKGPDYAVELCCPALKQFACKFATYINDLTTNCADTMFSYINLYGKYPPALFAITCREGKESLACDAEAPDDSNALNAYKLVLNFSFALWNAIINVLGVLVYTA